MPKRTADTRIMVSAKANYLRMIYIYSTLCFATTNSVFRKPLRTEICLQEERNVSFELDSKYATINYTEANKSLSKYVKECILYKPNDVKKVPANQLNNAIHIDLVKETIQRGKGRSSVQLQQQWDFQSKMFKISVVADLDKSFYSLPKMMKIQLKGSFKVLHSKNKEYIPLSQKTYDFEAEIVPGLRIVEVNDFKGSSVMEGFINGIHILRFDIRYSVAMVWSNVSDAPITDGKSKLTLSEGKELGNTQQMYSYLPFPKKVGVTVSRRSAVLQSPQMYRNKQFSDFKILTKAGTEIPCHRSILSSHGTLSTIVKTSNSLDMKDTSEKSVDVFLKFVYKVDILDSDYDIDVILDLLTISNKYNIVALQEKTLDVILFKSDDWFNLNSALTIYFFKSNINIENFQKVKTKMLLIMKRNPEKLKQSTAFKAMLKHYPAKTAELTLALFVV